MQKGELLQMIISANQVNDFKTSVEKISDNDPFACRIISLYNSYQPDLAFVDYWLISNVDGVCTGAAARSGTNFVLFITDGCDLEEISSFMRVAGASSILCSGKYNLDLFGYKKTTGAVLVRNTPFEFESDGLNIVEPDIKDAYDLIVRCADDNFRPPLFEDFYVDVNHKLRHKTMRMYAISCNGNLAAVAMTVAECGDGAVLGAVSCDPDYRKQGYGSIIVKYISNRLIEENKAVFLHRAKNANAAFYDNLGFKQSDEWCEYIFER